ncbi:MAG: rhamnulose-1-phosphate aldolase [Symbiobacteriaceae bacterium]|nr:rhamnulose-1-phosphate aldolase [Symbiobacteriaceae bacterium]
MSVVTTFLPPPVPQNPVLLEIAQACYELGQTDWCDGSAGNISLLLRKEEAQSFLELSVPGTRQPLAQPLPELDRRYIMITASGAKLRKLPWDPAGALVLVEICDGGASWRLVSGWGDTKQHPSSELIVHLLGHRARLVSQGDSRAILHVHPPQSIALTIVLPPDHREYTRLLWRMHTEGVAAFPEGVAALEVGIPGSLALARETAQAWQSHRLVFWRYHGLAVADTSLDSCLSLVEMAEKIIGITLHLSTYGYFRVNANLRMSEWQMAQLATKYKVTEKHKYWN